MRGYSKKGLEKRKAERACLPEFFKKHIGIARGKHCEECGTKLIGDVSEVAHILDKSRFKSIMCLDKNVAYLCSWKSSNNCHSLFDGSVEQLKQMTIFKEKRKVVIELLGEVTEEYNYKTTDKWEV